MYGMGNWTEIAEHVGTKSKEQCIQHYDTAYMNSPYFPLPDMTHVVGKNRKELLALAKGEGFKYINECFENGTLHLIGLLSDGGVHSRLDQLQLLLKGASEHGAKTICVHILTDGCDVLDGTSVGFVETLENDLAKLRENGVDAKIASGAGRMNVTMDRYEVQ